MHTSGWRSAALAAVVLTMAAGCTRATSVHQEGSGAGGVPTAGGTTGAPGTATTPITAPTRGGSQPRTDSPLAHRKAKTVTPSTGAAPSLAPVRIGAVGMTSGIGSTQIGTWRAVQAWAAWTNAKGGLAGHPVEVFTADDGGDAARLKANLRQLVEQNHVIAFVGATTAFSMSDGAKQYLEQQRVPLIGGDRLGPQWTSSPMIFPQASASNNAALIHLLYIAKLGGRGAPVGWITCQEAQQCRDGDAVFQEWALKLGLDPRYREQVTISNPNFTPQCVQAQQKGVQWLIVALDVNADQRLINDCGKQRYQPHFEVPQTSETMAQQDATQGTLFASATFPWAGDATPAMHEFAQVMHQYQPKLPLSGHASSGWVAAKLFERASVHIGPQPTSAQILEGLWAMQNENLGGLTAPLTFTRNQPAAPPPCYFPMAIRSKHWHAEATTITCLEGQ